MSCRYFKQTSLYIAVVLFVLLKFLLFKLHSLPVLFFESVLRSLMIVSTFLSMKPLFQTGTTIVRR